MAATAEDPRRWSVLWLVALGELLAMAPWFSASAVARPLNVSWRLDAFGLPGLAIAVQVGFAAGALALAATAAADRISARLLFAAGATLAAVANLGFAFVAVDAASALPFRALTGLALAGVYPLGLRLVVGWFRRERGTAIGVVVGALTVGSALPYLIRALGVGQDDWRTTVASASVLALIGGFIVLVAGRAGPWDRPAPRFTFDVVRAAFREPAVRLANVGYLGHMWELYAMWTWIPLFLAASFATAGAADPVLASSAAFAVVASGGIGCVVAGLLADRVGRTATTIAAMAASGTSAIVSAMLFGAPVVVTLIVAVVWGITVVADSAQFSAAVSELAPEGTAGSALAVQTAAGFLLTTVTILVSGRSDSARTPAGSSGSACSRSVRRSESRRCGGSATSPRQPAWRTGGAKSMFCAPTRVGRSTNGWSLAPYESCSDLPSRANALWMPCSRTTLARPWSARARDT